jgi:hypothetical protein
MATEEEVQELADAMWQLLDDMGKGSQSVCLLAKIDARIAYEPFRDKSEPEYEDWLSYDDAKRQLADYEAQR